MSGRKLLTSICLNLFVYKMKIIIVPSTQDKYEDEVGYACKILRQSLKQVFAPLIFAADEEVMILPVC